MIYLFGKPHGRGYEAHRSPLVKKLLADGHRPVRNADGSIQIGPHRFISQRQVRREG